ncbi:MAG: hypothetical protein KatS3mg056_2049 [Chloroflexus sp.]|nr:MAG: hypothetical protein KatS3mg056_2049 [Chloroflexus sp.]
MLSRTMVFWLIIAASDEQFGKNFAPVFSFPAAANDGRASGSQPVPPSKGWVSTPGSAHLRRAGLASSVSTRASRINPASLAPAPRGLCITHMSRCVRPGCKRSPWRLPVVQASSLRASILATAGRCWPWPLVCSLLACATPATDTLRCCPGFPAMRYRFGQNVIVRMVKPARYALHTRRSRGPHSNRCHPPVIASTAGAAAWLPHSKLRDTRMMRV